MKNKNKLGFTLIELLMVIGIIGLLATMVVIGVGYARGKARISKAQHDIAELYTAISILANDTNQWPGHQTAFEVSSAANNEICGEDINSNTCTLSLSDNQSGILADDSYAGWQGPYMLSIPLDPWDREYFFDTDYSIDVDNNPCSCGGGGCVDVVVIGSYGPDGQGVPTGSTPGSYGCDDIIKIIEQ